MCGLNLSVFRSTFLTITFVVYTGTVSVFSEKGSVWSMHSNKTVLVARPQLHKIPFLQSMLSWSVMGRQVGESMYYRYGTSMEPYFLDFSVFVS